MSGAILGVKSDGREIFMQSRFPVLVVCFIFISLIFLSLSTVTSSCISSPERLKEKEAAASTAQVSYDVWIVWCLLIGRLWFFGGWGHFS